VKANKDTRKRLNGSTELERLEEERKRLLISFWQSRAYFQCLIQTGVA